MCAVSALGDYGRASLLPQYQQLMQPQGVSQYEFDALKREVEELNKLLKAADAYDKATNQPHCETDDKMDLLRKIAKAVGVDLEI